MLGEKKKRRQINMSALFFAGDVGSRTLTNY